MDEIDVDRLREDLEEYFGTAMFNGNPQAMIELEEVKSASTQELILIALNYGFDINYYIVWKEKYLWHNYINK